MKQFEQWQDQIARLFPEYKDKYGNGKDRVLSQTVTFQVTDACDLACFAAGTKILMSDFSYKNIEDVKIGDEVLAFNEKTEKGKQIKLIPTKVTHTFYRHDFVRKIKTIDGEEIICTNEHPFLDGRRQWVRAEDINTDKKLTKFVGIDEYTPADINSLDYMIGYVISVFLGDGSMPYYKHGMLRTEPRGYQSRLAVKDIEIIERTCQYLDRLNISYTLRPFKVSTKYNIIEDAIYLNLENSLKLKNLIEENWLINHSYNYLCGFLAGIIDTEGTVTTNCTRIFNSNDKILQQCEEALQKIGLVYTYDKERQSKNVLLKTIRILNPRNTITIIRLLLIVQNAVKRKYVSVALYQNHFKRVDVQAVENLYSYVPVYNLETESHTYIANNCSVHNCSYCYQIHKGKRSMSFETAKKYIDLIISGDKGFSDYINPQTSPGIIIEFIGGEPFLEIDLIDKICDYFTSQLIEKQHPWATKYMFSICSNGVSYFDERVQRFLRKWNGHISFSVTIDGNKELHDSCRVFPDGSPSYDLAVAAAKDWMSRGYQMGSKITIAPGNVTFFYDAIKHMIELGYTEINANCVYEKGWESKHAIVLYEEMKKVSDYFLEHNLDFDHEYYCSLFNANMFHPKDEDDLQNWCGGNGVMLSCDPDGYLFPCIRYMESSLGSDQEPYSIGHVDIGICQTECDKCRVECLKKINRRTQSTDECFNCPIAEGCSWCFKAGTLITTPDGFKEIQDIQVGDKVITGSGNIETVEKISSRYTDDTVLINATGLLPLYTTSEHPFWVRKFRRSGNNLIYESPQWVKASQIKKSDKIALFAKKFGDVHIDKYVAYIAGRYMGDGWKTCYQRGNCNSTEYHLCGNYNECNDIENYLQLAHIGYSKDNTKRTAQEYNIYLTNHKLTDNNELLISILSKSGQYSHGKYIPKEIFNWDKESIESFLKGYFDADGSYDKKRDVVKFTTVSLNLAQGISSLLLMFGKKCNWHVRHNSNNIINNRKVNTHCAYELSFLLREPRRKYYEFDADNNIMWVNVKEVNSNIDGYTVYNMSVSNEHTYLANGAIVHNCSAYNYQVFGTPDARATYICIMHKARALGNIYFWNKYYRQHGRQERMKMYIPDEWALEIINQNELNMLKELSKED